MWKSYLLKGHFFSLFFALVLALWMDWWSVSSFLLTFSVLYFFIYRKINVPKSDGNWQADDLIKSPVNGRVVSIREGVDHKIFGENLVEVGLIIPHSFEVGLYLPVTAEIEYSKNFSSRELFRYKREWVMDQREEVYGGTLMMLRVASGQILGLQMVKCFLGLSPKIWVLPGDRGKASTRFGYFPLGGSVFCYFPKSYEVITKVGSEMSAGETVIVKEKVEVLS